MTKSLQGGGMLLLALLFVLRPFDAGMLASGISGDGSGAGGGEREAAGLTGPGLRGVEAAVALALSAWGSM